MNIHSATPLDPLERYGLGTYDSDMLLGRNLLEADAMNLKDMRGVQKRYLQYVEEFVANTHLDAIHAHDWLTMEAGMRAKQLTDAPLIVHVHATEFDRSGEHFGNPVVHEIEQQALLMADRIIAVSNITTIILVQRYNIPAHQIELLYNALHAAIQCNH